MERITFPFQFPFPTFGTLKIIIIGLAVAECQSNDIGCATIELAKQNVTLYENGHVDQSILQGIRDDYGTQFSDSTFHVRNASEEGEMCILEICGFVLSSIKSFREVNCDLYETGSTRAVKYEYEVTSMSCACAKPRKECKKQTCESQQKYSWSSFECAILYQEKNCQSCFFDSITLNHGKMFPSLNSYQMKSAIIRDGCQLEQITKGSLFFVREEIFSHNYTGIVDITPVYHKDSANFTCQCDSEVMKNMSLEAGSEYVGQHFKVNNDIIETNNGGDEDSKNSFVLPGLVAFSIITIMAIGLVTYVIKKRKRSNERHPTGYENDVGEIYDGENENRDEQQSQEMVERLKPIMEEFVKGLMHPKEDDKILPIGISVANPDIIQRFHSICRDEFAIKREDFTLENERLGWGEFGVVCKGVVRYGDGVEENIAVKRPKWSECEDKERQNSFLRELEASQNVLTLGNENVVRFIGACEDKGQLYLLFELCEKGSLSKYLEGITTQEIRLESFKNVCDYGVCQENAEETTSSNEKQMDKLLLLLKWSLEIARGMDYLSQNRCTHLDLAARNVLLTANLTAKVCDLGLSRKYFKEKDYLQYLLKKTFPINSFAPECLPERLHGNEMTRSSSIDVWAYGCTLFEIFSFGERPYAGFTDGMLLNFLRTQQRLPKPKFAPDSVYAIMLDCWREMPEMRPSFTQLVERMEAEINQLNAGEVDSGDISQSSPNEFALEATVL